MFATGGRRWTAEDVSSFEAIAGALLSALGYELAEPLAPSAMRQTLALARYRLTLGAWNAAVSATQRSPVWRRRHPPVRRPAERRVRG